MAKAHRAVVLLLSAWLLAWIVYSWPALQDDALIHLRYADHLLHQHMVSYDGVHQSFGASSLLYIAILALLRAFTESPVLPRAVSSAGHMLLFGGLAWGFARSLKSKAAHWFALLLLGSLALPSAVRWLDDGMETSLGLCVVTVFAFLLARISRTQKLEGGQAAVFAMLGFFAVMLRIELLMLFGLGSLMLLLALGENSRWKPHGLALASLPLAGALLAALTIYHMMHSLLPDTALAKSGGFAAWHDTAVQTVHVFASSMGFGLIPLLLWPLTLAALVLMQKRLTLSALLANSTFPIVLALAVLRGQAVQGVRYFSWTLTFSVVWNILELNNAFEGSEAASPRSIQLCAWVVTIFLLVLFPAEPVLFRQVFALRSASLAEFRAQHLERLAPMEVVAFDIGYIGYFSGSSVCDMAGLANGRVAAGWSYDSRVEHCAASHPGYAFGNLTQLKDLNSKLDLAGWTICSQYELANLRSSDRHYLIAPPETAVQVCSAAGGVSSPFAPVLRGAP